MANTNKTKAEILQELESIKGLLLEDDDIPILQTIAENEHPDVTRTPPTGHTNPTVLPGQTSLFDSEAPIIPALQTQRPPQPKNVFNTSPSNHTESNQGARNLLKASGENPFLPQHIRERLHGNNPPPLFEYETAKKILNASKTIAHKINKPRQALVEELINGLRPQIEAELRHRLFAMSVEDLEKLLNEDED